MERVPFGFAAVEAQGCPWSRCSPTATKNGDFRRSRHRTQGRAKTPVNTGDDGLPKSPSFGQSVPPELRKPNKTRLLYRFLLRATITDAEGTGRPLAAATLPLSAPEFCPNRPNIQKLEHTKTPTRKRYIFIFD